MARYNRNTTTNAPRTAVSTVSRDTAAPDALTFEGGAGWLREAQAELFLAAVTDLNEDLFYESAGDRAERIERLVAGVAVSDPTWVLGLVGWLRRTAGLRSSAVNVAVAAAHARFVAEAAGHTRKIVDAAIARADEPAELLACWIARYGRSIPIAVKRGVGDGAVRTWNEASVLKWRGKGSRGDVGMRDVLNLVHPSPKDARQGALFEAILTEAYGREAVLDDLLIMRARRDFLALGRGEQLSTLLEDGSTIRRDAALTHEVIAGALGTIPGEVWEELVDSMGYTALMMNLRRIVESGVSAEVVREVSDRLADPDEVRRSGVMPVRLLSAYRNAPLEFAPTLQKAMEVSTENVPSLMGRTLVLVDCSGSMSYPLSERGTLTRMDAASVFGAALALRGEDVTLVRFGSDSEEVAHRRGDGVLRLADRMPSDMGGTNTRGAVDRHYAGHDRVIVLTDEQAGFSGYYGRGDVFASVPEKVHAFTWNLAGYRVGHAPSGSHRHAFGGLSDASFDLVERVEHGFAGAWPWE